MSSTSLHMTHTHAHRPTRGFDYRLAHAHAARSHKGTGHEDMFEISYLLRQVRIQETPQENTSRFKTLLEPSKEFIDPMTL